MHEDAVDVEDLIDDIEENLDGHEEKIAALERLLADVEHGSRSWIELTVTLAEHRGMLGQHETAIGLFEDVRDADVPTEPSIEAYLLVAHLAAGHDDAAAELERELRARSRHTDLGEDYHWVGEAYEEAGRLKEALRWFTMANRDIDPEDLDELEPWALYGRRRVRQALDLPPDAYDEAAALLQERYRTRWAATNG